MSGLDEALEFLLEEEGGWSNHKNDRGGATMYGVTQAVYTAWRKKKGLPSQTVRKITHAEARALYEEEYWNAASCHKLPWPISYITFDAAVNSGAGRAVRWLQEGLNLSQDGIAGPRTIAAAQAAVDQGNGKALLAILDARVSFLARLVQKNSTQTDFLLGWWRRTQRVLARALLSD